MKPRVAAICLAPAAGERMYQVHGVQAIAGRGFAGDRYSSKEGGSWNKGKPGKRQATFMNAAFLLDSGFTYEE